MIWHVFAFAVIASALQTLPPTSFQGLHSEDSEHLLLSTVERIIYIQSDIASWTDQNGSSLIPPSVAQFAETFRQDIEDLTNCSWSLQNVSTPPRGASGVFLGLLDNLAEPFTYEDGTPSEEGYELLVNNRLISICGSGARGIWWGTRTVLQNMVLNHLASVPIGRLRDTPAYPTRGFMLDAGRKWYSLEYLKDLCTYASFFKLSEFHYHATDNYPLSRGRNETWGNVYSQFSLRPENPELLPIVQRLNETLTRWDFDDFQTHCARRGITVIPEIESPGHCLSITKWKPELALKERDLLNLTHPETIPLVKSIWSEFLPWFHTKEVHIGADEYDSALADDYINFVNDMANFISDAHGKKIRIWGTYEPSKSLSINPNITIQHWQYGQSDPVTLAENGYQIINSEDWWAYMSLKNNHVPITPAPYPQFFNNSRVLNFGDIEGWQWTPQLFNHVNTTDQPPQSAVRGAILAAWNDNGPDATTQLESYYAIRNGIPVVASRAWSGRTGSYLDISTLDESIDLLTANAVSQNLDRSLRRKQPSPLQDTFSWHKTDSLTSESPHPIGLGSKGMNYTLELNVTGTFSLYSKDAHLSLGSDGQLVFSADGWSYPLRSVLETDGFDSQEPGRIWANSTGSTHEVLSVPLQSYITIKSDQVYGSRVWVGNQFMGRFEVFVYGGKNEVFSWSQMAFVAPLEYLVGNGIQDIFLE